MFPTRFLYYINQTVIKTLQCYSFQWTVRGFCCRTNRIQDSRRDVSVCNACVINYHQPFVVYVEEIFEWILLKFSQRFHESCWWMKLPMTLSRFRQKTCRPSTSNMIKSHEIYWNSFDSFRKSCNKSILPPYSNRIKDTRDIIDYHL